MSTIHKKCFSSLNSYLILILFDLFEKLVPVYYKTSRN